MEEQTLPQWAIDAGWTEQDLADGWRFTADVVFPRAYSNWRSIEYSAYLDGDVTVDDGQEVRLVHATSHAAARQCVLEIVAAVNRARGEQG